MTSFFRWAIGLYILCIFGLFAAFFYVSTLDVQQSLIIQGPSTLFADQPNALRATVIDTPSGQPRRNAVLTVTQADKPRDVLTYASAERSGYIHTTLRPAQECAGHDCAGQKAKLVFSASSPTEADLQPYQATLPVDIQPPSAAELSPGVFNHVTRDVEVDESRPAGFWKNEGPTKFEIYPSNAELPRGLKSVLYLRTTDRETGKPKSCQMTLKVPYGIIDGQDFPQALKTGPLGLTRLEIIPMTNLLIEMRTHCGDTPFSGQTNFASAEFPSQPNAEAKKDASASAREASESYAKLHLATVVTQVSVRPFHSTIPTGQKLRAAVYSDRQRGGFLVDLYGGRQWISASAFGFGPGINFLEVQSPAGDPPGRLYRIQVYPKSYQPQTAWDVAFVVGVDTHTRQPVRQALPSAIEAIYRLRPEDAYFKHLYQSQSDILPTLDLERASLLLDSIMAAMPRYFQPPEVLIDTQHADEQNLNDWKHDLQTQLRLLLVLAFAVGGICLAVVVILGFQARNRQQAMLFEMEWDVENPEDQERETSVAQGTKPEKQQPYPDAQDSKQTELHARLERISHALQVLAVLATLAMFVLSLLLLLSFL